MKTVCRAVGICGVGQGAGAACPRRAYRRAASSPAEAGGESEAAADNIFGEQLAPRPKKWRGGAENSGDSNKHARRRRPIVD